MIATDASGATSAKRSNSCCVNSRSSTLMMSFPPIFFDGTFMTRDTGLDMSPPIPSIFRTDRALPAGTWSITVPFLIAVTLLMFAS